MESALGGLSQMAVLIIIAAVGFLAAKLNYLDKYTNQKLTKLLLNITLPCMIIASVHGLSASDAGAIVGPAFLMAGAQFFLLLLTGTLLAFFFRVPKNERAIWQFMTVCTNNGFIGLPVIAAILGTQSIIVSSIYIMVIALFIYSIGFAILANNRDRIAQEAKSGIGAGENRLQAGKAGAEARKTDGDEDNTLRVEATDGKSAAEKTASGKSSRREKFSIPWRSMINPAMVACLIALVLFFTSWQVPDLVQDTLSLLGGITAPIAMLIIGVIMAGTKLKSVLTEVRLYPYILIRQLILPVLFYLAFVTMGVSPLLAGVFSLMFAMPVGSMAPTFVEDFDGDATLTAKATVLTTLGAFAMIPLLVVLMGFAG